MFGTIARVRIRSGTPEERIQGVLSTMANDRPEGAVGITVLRSQRDSNELWIAGVFENEDVYRRNADSPGQQARYEKLAAISDGAPEWHDGEVLTFVADAARASAI